MFRQRLPHDFVLIAVFLFFSYFSIDAKIIFVNWQSSNPSSPFDNWGAAAQKLEDAVGIAEDGDEVWIASGIYQPEGDNKDAAYRLGVNLHLYGGFSGSESSIIQRDLIANPTVLSGDISDNDDESGYNDNLYSVLVVDDGNPGTENTVSLDGFLFRGSRILNRESLSIDNCSFTGFSDFFGGALFSDGGTVVATNSQFLNCIGTFGGAVRLNPTSNFTAINCKFSGNSTPTGSGGAIDHENANGSYINCEFSGNQANFGGAVRSVLSSPIFINCTFSGNSANDDGGAVYNIDMANPSFTNCVIWNNRESASTKTTSASVFSVVSSNPTYSHSIIANSGGSADWDGGLGTDLGNNLDVDPLFIDAFNPGVAPSTGGDLRVTTGSPILDAGDYGSYDGNDGPETDLLGNLRLFDDPTVTDSGIGAFLYLDLGCYEGAADFTTPEIESWAVPTDVPVTTNFFEFHLSFSEIVQNLSSGDFHFSIDGNLNFSSLTIESEENGKSYSVTLSGITGAGMVRVSLEEAHDVSDPSGNKVVELTSSDLFYVDPIYTIHYVNALSTKPEVPYNTWKKAATHVQDVIPFSADGDQIWIAAGSYTPGTQREDSFRIKNEISLFGGFIGNEGSLEERIGSGVESILSGDLSSNDESAEDNSENAYQVVSIDDNNPATKKSVLLNSLVIEGGNADSEQVERQTGGGIYNAENLSVENCILRNNFGKMGGAIYSIFANLEMNSTTILGNSANFGAGLFNNGSSQFVVNTTISGNVAGDGGAIRNSSGASILVNCLISGNAASFGGGLSSDGSDTTLVNCTISGNWAYEDGGALFNSSNSNTLIRNCILWNNRAAAFTSRATSSVTNLSSTTQVWQSLVANSGGSESWDNSIGIDQGGNSDQSPYFFSELDPINAPSQLGDFRLLPVSHALDRANYDFYTSANGPNEDLFGANRLFDDPDTNDSGIGASTFLDLGALEFHLDSFGMYARWIYNYYPVTTPIDQLSPIDDNDDDYIENLLEYAFDLNPSVFDRSSVLGGSIGNIEYPNLVGFITPTTNDADSSFVFGRNTSFIQMGLQYTVQISNDLKNWSSLDGPPLSLATGNKFELLSFSLPSVTVEPSDPAFLRLHIELEEE